MGRNRIIQFRCFVTGFDSNYNDIESVNFDNKVGLERSVIYYGDIYAGEGNNDFISY